MYTDVKKMLYIPKSGKAFSISEKYVSFKKWSEDLWKRIKQ